MPLANGANLDAAIVALGPCTSVPLTAPSCTDPAPLTDPPALVFYQARGQCADGTEGVAHPF